MNAAPPAAIDPHKNGTARTMKRIVVWGGAVLMAIGFVTLIAELWRTYTGVNTAIGMDTIRWKYLGLSAAILGFGFGIAQTGDALSIFKLAWDGWRFRNTMAPPGKGRRYYDPPPETAPPEAPSDELQELFRTLPPRTARQRAADRESAAADRAAERAASKEKD